MPNLTLLMGNNSIAAHTDFSVRPASLAFRFFRSFSYTPQPNNSPEGREILANFVGKKGKSNS